MDMLVHALSEGKICVIDVSQMRGGQSLVLSGLILRRIFDRNQQEFTAADPWTIPTIAVVEEAQSVLKENAPASEPYVAWVKKAGNMTSAHCSLRNSPAAFRSKS